MRLKYLVVVFVIAVFLRSVNLELIPRWHWDEAANLDITANLLSGRAQVFALKYPFFPHPPLFFVFAAPFIKLLGASNLSLRVFAATLSTATAVVVYLTTSRIFDDKKALVAGILYAVNPIVLYWGRMGMVNNLVVFLSVCSLYFFTRFLKDQDKKSLIASAILSGFCAITGLIGVSAMLAVYYLTFKYSRKSIKQVILASLVGPITFTSIILYSMPDYFIHDVLFLQQRFHLNPLTVILALSGLYLIYLFRWFLGDIAESLRNSVSYAPLLGFLVLSIYALLILPKSDEGYLAGIGDYLTLVFCFGFLAKPVFYVTDERKKNPTLTYLAAYSLFLFATSRLDHMATVLYPFSPILASNMLARLYDDAKKLLAVKKIPHVAIALLLVYHPLIASSYQSLNIMSAQTVKEERLSELMRVSEHVNNITTKDSVVVGYWMSDMLDAHLCTPEQAAAYDGYDTFYHSGRLPRNRFTVNCSVRNADVVILADETASAMNEFDCFNDFLSEVFAWPMHYVGEFGVYANPRK